MFLLQTGIHSFWFKLVEGEKEMSLRLEFTELMRATSRGFNLYTFVSGYDLNSRIA